MFALSAWTTLNTFWTNPTFFGIIWVQLDEYEDTGYDKDAWSDITNEEYAQSLVEFVSHLILAIMKYKPSLTKAIVHIVVFVNDGTLVLKVEYWT